MKKSFFLIIFVLFVAVIVTSCINNTQEEIQQMIPQDKMNHAIDMMFRQSFIVDGERHIRAASDGSVTNPRSTIFNPIFTELIFVHSQEEAVDMPDNVVIAWPCCFSIGVLKMLNEAVNRTENDIIFWRRQSRDILNLEDFGLVYPLTITDIVDNWEQVRRVWFTLTQHEQQLIFENAHFFGIDYRRATGESHLCCFDPSSVVIP